MATGKDIEQLDPLPGTGPLTAAQLVIVRDTQLGKDFRAPGDRVGSVATPAAERPQRIDPSRPIAYAGFATRIDRLNYATYPPAKTSRATTNLTADWANRTTLSYS